MAKKHKAATEVTLVHEEKSALAAAVEKSWPLMAGLAALLTAVILYNQHKGQQAEEDRSNAWLAIQTQEELRDSDALLRLARDDYEGTELAQWAALSAVPNYIQEKNYGGAIEAVDALESTQAPLFTELPLPLSADGKSVTLAANLRQAIGEQQAQDEKLASIFENPMPPEGSTQVEMTIDIGGNAQPVVLTLYDEEAPKHVENFVKLVSEGYYDQIKFHRIIEGFMIQAGDPNTKDPDKDQSTWGQGGPEYKIESEAGDLVHSKYVLAAAKGNEPQSSGSQFYIATGTPHHLDGIHTIFGVVTEGHAAIDTLEKVAIQPPTSVMRDIPMDPIPFIVSTRVLGGD